MVKKFIGRILIICVVPLILFMAVNVVYYEIADPPKRLAGEVYEAINISGRKTDYTALILGDSVGRQFFSPEAQDESTRCCYLATNQAITVAGNAILLQRFLENNPQLEEVYYIARPNSITGGIDFVYTYSYFIMPLFNESFHGYLYPETVRGVETVFGKVFTEREFLKWMITKYPKILEMYNRACKTVWEFGNKTEPADRMPDVSVKYLAKMKQVCDENGVEMHLVCVPLPEDFAFDRYSFEDKMRKAGLADLYEEYTADWQYLDKSEFVDGIHLRKEYVEKNRETFVNRVLR